MRGKIALLNLKISKGDIKMFNSKPKSGFTVFGESALKMCTSLRTAAVIAGLVGGLSCIVGWMIDGDKKK